MMPSRFVPGLIGWVILSVFPNGSPAASGWSASVGLERLSIDGWIQVGEFGEVGTHLRLDEDLDIRSGWAADLATAYRFSDRSRLSFSFTSLMLRGDATAPDDVVYDEAHFPAGTDLKSRPLFYVLKGAYARTLFGRPDRLSLDGLLGIEYVYLDFKIKGTPASGPAINQGEQFWIQELPLPFLGAAVSYHPDIRWLLAFETTWYAFRDLNSLRHEGGLVRLTQSSRDTRLSAGYGVSDHFNVAAGYRFWSYVQEEKSGEDDNRFHLRASGPFFRILWEI